MRTLFATSLCLLGLLSVCSAAPPALAQAGADQTIVLHCVKNQNESLDLVVDLGQRTYSWQGTLYNLPGSVGPFVEPAEHGAIDSISPGEVRFKGRVGDANNLNRFTGILDNDRYGSFKCERSQKVF
jgi:hypothetical protein